MYVGVTLYIIDSTDYIISGHEHNCGQPTAKYKVLTEIQSLKIGIYNINIINFNLSLQ